MNTRIPTITIKTENGPVLINVSDYDPEKHEPFAGDGTAPDTPAGDGTAPDTPAGDGTAPDAPAGDGTAPDAPAGGDAPGMMVTKKGRKFIVVDGGGKPVEREGIESNGYATEKAAWDAILSV